MDTVITDYNLSKALGVSVRNIEAAEILGPDGVADPMRVLKCATCDIDLVRTPEQDDPEEPGCLSAACPKCGEAVFFALTESVQPMTCVSTKLVRPGVQRTHTRVTGYQTDYVLYVFAAESCSGCPDLACPNRDAGPCPVPNEPAAG